MSENKQHPERRWPSAEIIRRADFADDAGRIRFIDTKTAAGYLALTPHTLEVYRSVGGGPVYHKFGRWVRYAVDDLDTWAAKFRHVTTATKVDACRSVGEAAGTRPPPNGEPQS